MASSMISRNTVPKNKLVTQSQDGTETSTDVLVGDFNSFSFSGGGRGDKLHNVPFSFRKRRHALEGYEMYQYAPGVVTSPKSARLKYGDFRNHYGYPQLVAPHYPDLFNFDSLYRKALEKFYKKVKDSDVDIAIDVAEWRQLVRMVPNTLRAASQVVNIANRCRSLPGGLANSWLGYQYGWRPLLKTIYNIAHQSVVVHGKPIHVRSAARDKIKDQRRNAFGTFFNANMEASKVCKLGGCFTVTNPRLFEASRLATLNPVGLAWELLPYSFVVDWFFDIGNYLKCLEASFGAGLQFQHGYRVDSFKASLSNSSIPGPYPMGAGMSKLIVINGRDSVSYLNRQTLTSWPRPLLPTFKPELGSQRLLSAASLLQQYFFQKRKR